MAKANPVQVQTYLKGVDYPAGKEDLIERATEEGAPEDVLETLNGIADREYQTPADLAEELSESGTEE